VGIGEVQGRNDGLMAGRRRGGR